MVPRPLGEFKILTARRNWILGKQIYQLIINENDKLTLGISKFPQVLFLNIMWASRMVPMQETPEVGVPSLGLEGPLEEEVATHSSILAWRIPWTEEPGGLQFVGSQTVRQD